MTSDALRRRAPRPLRPANPEFRALWWAEAISLVGDQLTRVAITIIVFDRTSSAAWTALTYAMTYLPDLLAGPLLSGLADRLPRRELMTSCCLIQAALVAAMTAPGLPIWGAAGLVAASTLVQVPFRAAQNASVLVVVEDRNQDYHGANASMTLMRESGQLVGLAGAGAVISLLGVTTALLVDAASFFVAGLLVARKLQKRRASRSRMVKREKWRLNPAQRTLVTFTWLCALNVAPYALAAPLIHELGGPTWAVAVVLAAETAGMVLAGLLLRRYVSISTQLSWMGRLAVLSAAALIPIALADHWAVAALLLFISGAGAAYTMPAKSAYLGSVHDAQRGYVVGIVRTILRGSQGLVVLAVGWLAQVSGSATQVITGVGIAGAVLCLVTARAWRRTHHLLTLGTAT